MICAGIALILGTTSVGASLFGNDDTVQQREEPALRPLEVGNNDPTDTDLDSENANPITEQPVLAPATETSKPRKTNTGNTLGAATNLVEQITPPANIPVTDPPAIVPDPPVDPADPDPDPEPPDDSDGTSPTPNPDQLRTEQSTTETP